MRTDTERLDAIGDLGLCVVKDQTLVSGVWHDYWRVSIGDQMLLYEEIRDAIDAAMDHYDLMVKAAN